MENYKLRNFKIEEFVDRNTFQQRGELAISVMDWRILWTADAIRDYFKKPMTINNWSFGGNREWSGIRPPNTPFYSRFSQHSFGRAIDFLISGIDSTIVRKTIRDNPKEEAFKYITCIEDFSGMSWCHVDCRVLTGKQKRFLIVKG